jgi:hypothetical protein
VRQRAPGTGHQPPWWAAAARKEARHLAGSAGTATPPHPAATRAAAEEALATSRPQSATPPVLLVCNALECAAADLLVHEVPNAGIALHIVAVRGLKLRPVFHRAAPKPIAYTLRHCLFVWQLCSRNGKDRGPHKGRLLRRSG